MEKKTTKKQFIRLLIVCLLLFFIAFCAYQLLPDRVYPDSILDGQLVGQDAPDFTVYTESGSAVHLSDFEGTPVVVCFWATWCPNCTASMPHYQAAYEQYGDEIAFMLLNMTDGIDETVGGASAYIAENGYTVPVYFDTEFSAAIAYEAFQLPTTLFINADGTVAFQHIGGMSDTSLEKCIKMLCE